MAPAVLPRLGDRHQGALTSVRRPTSTQRGGIRWSRDCIPVARGDDIVRGGCGVRGCFSVCGAGPLLDREPSAGELDRTVAVRADSLAGAVSGRLGWKREELVPSHQAYSILHSNAD
jgi:hypothetical protein